MIFLNVRHLYYVLLSGCIITFLSGCLPLQLEGEETTEVEIEETPMLTAPSMQVEDYYPSVYPYISSETRGTIQSHLGDYRFDADRLEMGLLEVAQDYFPSDNYLFQEGRLITSNELETWLLAESEEAPSGLNPEGSTVHDQVLAHIVEHNYLSIQGDELEGVVIGLALASTYREDGEQDGMTLTYTEDQLRTHGMEMADQIAERVKAKAEGVPIVIALYQLEEKNGLVPGNFLSVGYVEGDENKVSDWNAIDEFYLLFPSSALTSFDHDLADHFSTLQEETDEFFPQYVGMVGTGRFIEEQLIELTIRVNADFASKTEVIQLTQFLGGRAVELLPEHVHLSLYVHAVNEPQSIFIRPANGESSMHIYR